MVRMVVAALERDEIARMVKILILGKAVDGSQIMSITEQIMPEQHQML